MSCPARMGKSFRSDNNCSNLNSKHRGIYVNKSQNLTLFEETTITKRTEDWMRDNDLGRPSAFNESML